MVCEKSYTMDADNVAAWKRVYEIKDMMSPNTFISFSSDIFCVVDKQRGSFVGPIHLTHEDARQFIHLHKLHADVIRYSENAEIHD